MMRNLIFCLTVGLGLVCGSITAISQSVTQAVPTGCEYNTAILDGLAQKTDADELIIVIARLGPQDTKPNLNNRRLHNVRTYFTEVLTDPRVRRRAEMLVFAQGEPAPDYGRLEFYVKGKLVNTLRLRANADLSVANCGSEPPENPCAGAMRNLYPCKDKSARPPKG